MPTNSGKNSQILIRLPFKTHANLKLLATKNGKSLQSFCEDALTSQLQSEIEIKLLLEKIIEKVRRADREYLPPEAPVRNILIANNLLPAVLLRTPSNNHEQS
jgi:hypothetical protein